MKDKTWGPAFPRAGSTDPCYGTELSEDAYIPAQEGMSRLDYFTAAALQGLLANPTTGADMQISALTQGSRAATRILAECATYYAVRTLAAIDAHLNSTKED